MNQMNWLFILIIISVDYNAARIVEDKNDDQVSYWITPEDKLPVLAVETGYSSILIGTRDNVYLYNLSSTALSGLPSTPLVEKLKTSAETGYKELKLISENLCVYCNSAACRLCSIAVTKTYCVLINKKNTDAISSLSIAYIYPKLLLRIIDANHASTLLYNIKGVHTGTQSINANQHVFDDPRISQQVTVGAFSRGDFFYHIGSSNHFDDSLVNVGRGHSPDLLVVKIIRICALDKTKKLASQMELTLDCRSDDSVPITLLSRAHYDSTKEELWFTIHTANGESQMCKFDMKEVNDKFDEIWETCHTPVFEFDSERDCPKSSTDNEYCFAFARNTSIGRAHPCATLNMDTSAFNCNIRTDTKYGWIEYTKPLWRKPVYSVMSDKDNVMQILPVQQYNNTIYTSYGNNQKSNYVYWKNPISATSTDRLSHVLQISYNLGSSRNIAILENNICYIDRNSVRVVPISCQSFHKTCESLEAGKWSSPPGCLWCSDEGNETAVYENDNTCKNPITGQCPAIPKQKYPFDPSSTYTYEEEPTNTTQIFTSLSQYVRKVFYENETDWVMVSVLAGIIITLIVLAGFIVREQRKVGRPYRSYRERPTQLGQNSLPLLTNSKDAEEYLTPEEMISAITSSSRSKYDYGNLFDHIDEDIKIDISNLQLGDTIGEGNFGVVLRGTYITPDGDIMNVACKMLREGEPGVKAFFAEGLTMMNFHHARVIPFIGISLSNGTDPIIVTKFMPNGNLLKYMQTNANTISIGETLDFAIQIAEGMEYLHSKKFIHRDLAARNCMLDHKMQLKIGDFGLARQCNDQNMYLSCNYPDMPFAWASIEALEFWTFTLKGDIWSYGVVLWELMTKGERPSSKYTPSGLLKFLKQGKRLYRPLDCPEEFYTKIMKPCWDADMNERPSFSRLIEQLKTFTRTLDNNVDNHSQSQIYKKL